MPIVEQLSQLLMKLLGPVIALNSECDVWLSRKNLEKKNSENAHRSRKAMDCSSLVSRPSEEGSQQDCVSAGRGGNLLSRNCNHDRYSFDKHLRFRPKGAAISQPGATPQVTSPQNVSSPNGAALAATTMISIALSAFQGSATPRDFDPGRCPGLAYGWPFGP